MRPIISGFFKTMLLIALLLIGASLLGSLGLFVLVLMKAWNAFCAISLFDGKIDFIGSLLVVAAAWFLIMAVWANYMRMLNAYRDERGVGNKFLSPVWYVFTRTTLSFLAVFPWYLSVNHTLSSRGIYTFVIIGFFTVLISFKEGIPNE